MYAEFHRVSQIGAKSRGACGSWLVAFIASGTALADDAILIGVLERGMAGSDGVHRAIAIGRIFHGVAAHQTAVWRKSCKTAALRANGTTVSAMDRSQTCCMGTGKGCFTTFCLSFCVFVPSWTGCMASTLLLAPTDVVTI